MKKKVQIRGFRRFRQYKNAKDMVPDFPKMTLSSLG